MKRCPECRRDYYDDSLLYCVDDGSALLEGPASAGEHETAILPAPGPIASGFLGAATAILSPLDAKNCGSNAIRLRITTQLVNGATVIISGQNAKTAR